MWLINIILVSIDKINPVIEVMIIIRQLWEILKELKSNYDK